MFVCVSVVAAAAVAAAVASSASGSGRADVEWSLRTSGGSGGGADCLGVQVARYTSANPPVPMTSWSTSSSSPI